MIKLGRDYWSKLLLIGLIFGFVACGSKDEPSKEGDNTPFVPGYDRYDFGLGEENIESYRFGGESKPGDDRGAVSGIGIFRD